MANISRSLKAGVYDEVGVTGAFIRLAKASAPVTVRVAGDDFDMEAGDSVEALAFTNFKVKSSVDQDIELIVSSGLFRSNRQQGDMNIKPGESLNGLPRVTLGAAAGSVAANATRKKIYLSAPDANTAAIWIGATAVNNGLPLEPGDVMLLEVTGAIDYIGASGDKLDLLEVL